MSSFSSFPVSLANTVLKHSSSLTCLRARILFLHSLRRRLASHVLRRSRSLWNTTPKLICCVLQLVSGTFHRYQLFLYAGDLTFNIILCLRGPSPQPSGKSGGGAGKIGWYRCNKLRCPLARMSGLQCFNMGHNGHGINLYGVSMTLMGN